MERRGTLAWMAMNALLCLLAINVIAQPGFVSIDCGAERHHTSENNITWVTDADYISVGDTEVTGDATLPSYLQRMRFFRKPLNKSCYQLPVASNVPYLLRVWFALGNYSGYQTSFAFSTETAGMLYMDKLTITDQDPLYYERILVSSGTVLYICLIRTSESDDPFINAIELRTLRHGMYGQAKPGTMLHSTASRIDFGGHSTVRYPLDKFDRIWYSHVNLHNSSIVRNASSKQPISTNHAKDFPPTAVMQTAWVLNVNSFETTINTEGFAEKSLLLLYFAEIDTQLNPAQSRSFYITINGQKRSDVITLVPHYSALELALTSNETTDIFKYDLVKAINSTTRPLINAHEYYFILDTEPATYSQDIEALEAIKGRFNMKDWISDPCYALPWDGIGCDNRSLVIRISEINLSGRNITGSVPEDIGQLNALINLSLDNNQLMGHFPNLSSLIMLERLHLQNNNLTGSIPDWLSKLKNLKELFIENNNFSGVIPQQLLDNHSLKLNYSWNQYLCMHKGECIQRIQNPRYNSRKDKRSVVLGVTLSGAVITVLAFSVGIAVYWKKFRTTQPLNEEYPNIMVTTRAKSGAFTLKEITEATQNFSRKIGQGGFGSVFYGKLPDGKDIAVKVLSLFSKQGVHEFQNEVDLLSRIHHKHLVPLLGYCIESKELMLIYDHMSGGSLRDCLYGASSGISELNWKTRLKIALDAAQGLEYLHTGCTPKIIHRDVKSANILLDNNLNGKLADFGLSRMTIDGEATHVTTTVKGTAGYLDPEYFRTQMLTERSDVYSFGVVLLEIICGRPPINANLPEVEVNLVQWVTPYVKMDGNPEQIAEIIDKRLGGEYDIKSITSIAKLALKCVEAKPSSRPSATDVVAEIREAIIQENTNNARISEEAGIKYGDLQAEPVCSGVDNMEWADNSSNFPQVGR